jgi:hypothetical protein
MMEASDEAEVDEAPGEECSARMVVPWAIQELYNDYVSLMFLIDGERSRSQRSLP